MDCECASVLVPLSGCARARACMRVRALYPLLLARVLAASARCVFTSGPTARAQTHLHTAQGRAFLDRDPAYFSYVLDYLRNGGALPPNLPTDESELERVKEEFDYFCLSGAFSPPSPLKTGQSSCATASTLFPPPLHSPP